ncbi:MAG: glycosyltransferase [Alphaproteobacteria bacterium]|nr:glycosyltransferase [Alphaproteobacteria bacterium]
MRAEVAIVTPDTVGPVKNGGIGTACFHYARTLAAAGVPVDVLFTGAVEPADKARICAWYETFGLRFLSLEDVPTRPKYAYGTTWATERSWTLMQFLKERGYKYILFQDWHANGFWSMRAKQMGYAFADTRLGIITHSPNQWQREGMESHGGQPLEDADLEWAEREAIAAADVLVSPSRHMASWLLSKGYTLPADVAYCPYTFEDEVFAPRPETLDRDHLIFFGRLETRKGLHVLGSALRILKQQGKALPRKVSLLGKNATVQGRPTEEYVAALRADLPAVEFHVENDLDYLQAVAYLKAANGIVVIPSLLDNFPLTVVESVINGFCFFASTAGGIPEMIDPRVAFAPNGPSLAGQLARRHEIDWGALNHLYSPNSARETWLSHVRAVMANPGANKLNGSAPNVNGKAPAPISVCVPFYRHDQYIRRAVMALMRQRDAEVQMVVVNDGTPEEECPEFRRMREMFAPLGHIFHTQPNAGPGAARNTAARLAKHDLLMFVDSDNVPFPDMAAKLQSAMNHAHADSVAAPFAAVPPMQRMADEADVWFHFHPAGGSSVMALFDNVIADAAALVRRDVFEGLGGFTEERNSWEDWEFFLRLVLRGYRHFVYPEVLLFYSHDHNGRNETARTYHNRNSLLASAWSGSQDPQLGRIVEVLARHVLTAQGRL